jgi:hypothetical protein
MTHLPQAILESARNHAKDAGQLNVHRYRHFVHLD